MGIVASWFARVSSTQARMLHAKPTTRSTSPRTAMPRGPLFRVDLRADVDDRFTLPRLRASLPHSVYRDLSPAAMDASPRHVRSDDADVRRSRILSSRQRPVARGVVSATVATWTHYRDSSAPETLAWAEGAATVKTRRWKRQNRDC